MVLLLAVNNSRCPRTQGETMKLRAQIVIDINAANYAEAAEHQRHLELFLEQVKARYATAQLQMRERRERKTYQPPESHFSPRIIQVTNGRK